jgi:hypothetical protein
MMAHFSVLGPVKNRTKWMTSNITAVPMGRVYFWIHEAVDWLTGVRWRKVAFGGVWWRGGVSFGLAPRWLVCLYINHLNLQFELNHQHCKYSVCVCVCVCVHISDAHNSHTNRDRIIVFTGDILEWFYITNDTNHNYTSCFVWVWNLVSHAKGRA